MNKTLDFLKENQSSTPSRWKDAAQWRRDNAAWLKYSRVITLKVLKAMEDKAVTQADLAGRLGCTQQYISNLLKGSVNMTLETISKLEKALEIDILKSILA